MDYTAVGDTTNLAARLLDLAEPGQIVVSRPTHRITEGYFIFEDLGEFQFKGKTEPVRAYAVIGEMPGAQPAGGLQGARADAPGRTRARVGAADRGVSPSQHAATAPSSSCPATRASASRACSTSSCEVWKRRAHLELETTCVSYGALDSVPPDPGAPAAVPRPRGRAARRPRYMRPRRRAARRARPRGRGERASPCSPTSSASRRRRQFLQRLSGPQLKERTFDTVRTSSCSARADAQPVILVVENVHWIDASSEELPASIAGRRASRARGCCCSRHEPRRHPETGWLSPPLAETIALEAWTPETCRRDERRRCSARARCRSRCSSCSWTKGEGNPLYVEEILRQLQETGGIVVEDGEARLRGSRRDGAGDRSTTSSPPASTGCRRVAQADPAGRRGGGRQIRQSPCVPRRASERRSRGAGTTWTSSMPSTFVFPSARDPELMYSFKHALTQDVVYGESPRAPPPAVPRRRRARARGAVRRPASTRWSSSSPTTSARAGRTRRRSTTRSSPPRRRSAAGPTRRRSRYFEAPSSASETMPDTPPNRLRRIDAVVKQSEIKFALGRHAEHVQGPRGDPGSGRDRRRPAAAGRLVLTGRASSTASTGARPEVSDRLLPGGARRSRTRTASTRSARSPSAASRTPTSWPADLREALEAGERAVAIFEARGNVWWACRTLWGLSMAANASANGRAASSTAAGRSSTARP